MMHQWDGEERRQDSVLYDIVANLNEKVDKLVDEHKATRLIIEDHMKGEDHLLREFKNAFPEGDATGHRAYHDTVMKELERRAKFRDAVIEKSLAGLVWMMLVAFGTAVWQYIKDHLK